MTLQLRDIAERLNQTIIRIGIDLSRVQELRAGSDTAIICNGHESAEVYVVLRNGYNGQDTIHAFSVNADMLVLKAETSE